MLGIGEREDSYSVNILYRKYTICQMTPRGTLTPRKMYTRKVQVVGNGTIVVSLPREWIKKHNIGRKLNQIDEVKMEMIESGELVLHPPRVSYGLKPSKAVIRLQDTASRELMDELIVSAYLDGYSRIVIRSNKRITLALRTHLEKLTSAILNGYEVLGETERTVIIQGIMPLQAFDFERFFISFQARVEVLFKQVITYFRTNASEEESLEKIHHFETVLDRNYFLLLRALYAVANNPSLAQELKIHTWELLDFHIVLLACERIGDLLEEIALLRASISTNVNLGKVSKPLLDDLEKVQDFYTKAMIAFRRKDPDLASKLKKIHRERKTRVDNRWDDLIRLAIETDPTVLVIQHLLEKLVAYSSQIANAAINRHRKLLAN